MNNAIYFGIDVAKAQLDIAVRPSAEQWVSPHEAEGIAALVAWLQALRPTLIVLEATGGRAAPLATRAAAIRLLGQCLRLAVDQAAELARQIAAQARERCAPLLRLTGVNALTADALAAILGPGRRFRSDAELALYAGVAPLEVSSSGRVRHRVNRSGNRRFNAILYRIVLTQVRCLPAARAYVARRVSEGKTKREAIRALKRYIVRAIWRLWQECLPLAAPTVTVTHPPSPSCPCP